MDCRCALNVSRTLLLILPLHSFESPAEEGFFFPHQVPYDHIREKYGVTLSQADVEQLAQGVIQIEAKNDDASSMPLRGSGSLISPDGLILTNRHVAEKCFADLKSLGDISNTETSFKASSYTEELPCQKYTLYLFESLVDVTPAVQAAMTPPPLGPDETMRVFVIPSFDQVAQALISECEGLPTTLPPVEFQAKQSQLTTRCEMRPFPSLKRYFLEKVRVIRDVRLVYLPPPSPLANNHWPSHDLDFAFLRAYGTADRSLPDCLDCKDSHRYGAYIISLGETFFSFLAHHRLATPRFVASPTNQPLDTQSRFLRPETNHSAHSRDFVMSVGFPGITSRYEPHQKIYFKQHFFYPTQIRTHEAVLQFTNEQLAVAQAGTTEQDQAMVRQLKLLKDILETNLSAYQGALNTWKKLKHLEKTQARDRQLQTVIANTPALQEKYGDLFEALDHVTTELQSVFSTQHWTELLRTAGMLAFPILILNISKALHAAPEIPAHTQQRDEFIRALVVNDQVVGITTVILQAAIDWHQRGPDYHVPVIAELIEHYGDGEEDTPSAPELAQQIVQDWVSETRLFNDAEYRRHLFDLSPEDLQNSQDPLLAFSFRVLAAHESSTQRFAALHQEAITLGNRYEAALAEALPNHMPYYNANGSLRFSYGHVRGYIEESPGFAPLLPLTFPRLNFYPPVSRFSDFNHALMLPFFGRYNLEQWSYGRRAAQAFGALPVNMLSTIDIAPGNSGSPLINRELKVVGTVFALVSTAVTPTADVLYIPHRPTAIAISLPFMLAFMDKDMAGEWVNTLEASVSPRYGPTASSWITQEIQAASRGVSLYQPPQPKAETPPTPLELLDAQDGIPPPPPLPIPYRFKASPKKKNPAHPR